MTDMQDVIQAFADGEPVDPQELDGALADGEGRAHLIDLLVLRGFMKNPRLALPLVVPAAPVASRAVRWLPVAAGIVAMTALGGYIAGERAAASRQQTQPAFETTAAAPVAAPAPTHIIRFEPGVDWTEQKGGH